jgi:hypothetical protein
MAAGIKKQSAFQGRAVRFLFQSEHFWATLIVMIIV